jgi:hypothetical protein
MEQKVTFLWLGSSTPVGPSVIPVVGLILTAKEQVEGRNSQAN